jgi:oxalate decarboxylase/phosphoglucose isomerase-like protein (cupin superfamily)
MNIRKPVSIASLVLIWSVVGLAQDPVKVDPGHYKVVLENASVRVLRIHYPAGEKSPMHQHPDAIVVPLGASTVRFTLPDGKSEELNMPSESATYTPAGTHSPANVGAGPIDAVLVEFKSAAAGAATLPSSRANMAMKVLADSPRAAAYRMTAEPAFQEPAGSKHDYDQIVIALDSAEMMLAIDGKPAKTAWARGDVQFIGRGVAHESRNTGGKPVAFVIVFVR